jgi:exopolysaccharide biosynthesis polyprenyl glycosylphosphotransferase
MTDPRTAEPSRRSFGRKEPEIRTEPIEGGREDDAPTAPAAQAERTLSATLSGVETADDATLSGVETADDWTTVTGPEEVASPSGPPVLSLPSLKLIVPGVDLLALSLVVLLAGQERTLPFAYAACALLALSVVPRPRITPKLSEDVGWILSRLAVPLLLVLLVAGVWGMWRDTMVGDVARLGLVAAGSVLLGRGFAYALIRWGRSRGLIAEPTVIVGAGPIGAQIAETLMHHPEFGLPPVGFLDVDVPSGGTVPLPVLGEASDLPAIVREHGIERVIVAFGATRDPDLVAILRACDGLPVEVHLVPRFFELGVGPEGPEAEDLWGLPIVRLNRAAARRTGLRLKRVFDIVVGSVMVVVFAPLILASAIAVRLSSPGPILFRQVRVGRRGTLFELLKFRTMLVNEDSDTQWSSAEGRVTRVGRLLRRTCIDELPQLVNVLRGDMSLVGPRPERPHFVDQFSSNYPRYRDRHRVPAGLTGWAQVHGLRGASTSIPERIQLDNYYIEHWSLWRDVVILARTVRQLISGEGG